MDDIPYALAKSIVGALRYPMLIVGTDLRVIAANQIFCQLSHTSPEAIEGHLIDEADIGVWAGPGLRTMLQKALLDDIPIQNYEIEHDFPGIGPAVMMLNAVRVKWQDNGTPVLFLTIECAAENKLTENLVRLQKQLLDAAQQAIVATNLDGTITYWNRYAESLYGWSAAEVMGRNVLDVTLAETSRDQATAILSQMAHGESWTSELQVQRQDGTNFPAQITDTPLRDDEGHIIGIASVSKDITKRTRAKEDIKRAYRELEMSLKVCTQAIGDTKVDDMLGTLTHFIVDAVPTAEAASLWLYDADKNVLIARGWANHEFETIAGLTVAPESGLVGLVYRSQQPHTITDVTCEPPYELRDGGTPVHSILGVPLLTDGHVIGVLVAENFSRSHTFGDNDLRLLQALAVPATIVIRNFLLFDEVTQAREKIQQLAKRIVDTQEEERLRVSRELHDEAGQALTALKVSLELILVDARAGSELLYQRLSENVELTDRTIEQIRLVAQNLRPPALDAMGLNAFLENFCLEFASRTQIEIDYAGMIMPVLPDTMKLYLFRLLQEALTNVVKHAHAKHAWVRLGYEVPMISLTIEDDGQGFELELQKPVRSKGIGLLGMQERIQLLGGSLEIDTQPGNGTRIMAQVAWTEG